MLNPKKKVKIYTRKCYIQIKYDGILSRKKYAKKLLNIFYCCYFDTRNPAGTG